jgi:glycosyltransferase involved in cell wall biosynthesis
MTTPTLGLALISKNEQENLPHLLASIEGSFDQVVLLDTGSEDRTVEIFEEWAKAQDSPLGYKVDHFEWIDDFAAARNAADDLLETDWLCWADCDDEIEGAAELRSFIGEMASPRLLGYRITYRYAHEDGECIEAWRALRLVRRGTSRWHGRVCEAKVLPAEATADIPPHLVSFVHRKEVIDLDRSRTRDMRILEAWLHDEPYDLLALATAAWFAHGLKAGCYMAHYLHHYHLAQRAELDRARTEPGYVEKALERVASAARLVETPLADVGGVFAHMLSPETAHALTWPPLPPSTMLADKDGKPMSLEQLEETCAAQTPAAA